MKWSALAIGAGRIRRLAIPLLAACLLAGPFQGGGALGAFYKYITEDGRTFYVDDLSKVPDAYQDQIHTYREPLDDMTEDERRAYLEQERLAAEAREAARRVDAERAAYQRYMDSLNTPVKIIGNQVLVPVTLGHGVRQIQSVLLLDTGATVIALNRNVADRLYLPSRGKVRARMADGQSVDADIVQLDYVQVGPHRREGLRAGVLDQKDLASVHDGLLGMNFLRGLDYRIDFDNAVIQWRPEALHAPPQEGGQD